jgi:hypothetical protein
MSEEDEEDGVEYPPVTKAEIKEAYKHAKEALFNLHDELLNYWETRVGLEGEPYYEKPKGAKEQEVDDALLDAFGGLDTVLEWIEEEED